MRLAGTTEGEAVVRELRGHTFDTIIGPISFNAKGDMAGAETFVWYVWKDGTYVRAAEDKAVAVQR